jgi:7-cyano-7-deazaguanine synthase
MASAIVLFSGGIDSTTTAAIARHQGFSIILLSFDYGQRHRIELEKAAEVAKQFPDAVRILFPINLGEIGGSALTSTIEVPKNRPRGSAISDQIPSTYVPGRNLIFLSIAAAFGEVHQAFDLFYGANVLDYSGYPDCRPEFIESLETTLRRGTRAGVEGKQFCIHAPLLRLSKKEIILRGMELEVDYTHTHSCYDPGATGLPCGECDSCLIRAKGFAEAGLVDPAIGESNHE